MNTKLTVLEVLKCIEA